MYVVKNHLPFIVAVQSMHDTNTPGLSSAVLLTERRLIQLKKWATELLTKQFERDTLCRIDFVEVEVEREFY